MSSVVSTEYTRVTDGRTDPATACIPRYAKNRVVTIQVGYVFVCTYCMVSISRKNCYIVSAGDLQNRYSAQEESGKRMTPGLLIGCHIDTSTGLVSFTVNGQEAANKFQVLFLRCINYTYWNFINTDLVKLDTQTEHKDPYHPPIKRHDLHGQRLILRCHVVRLTDVGP